MRIGYTEEQEALRQELRRYYAEMLTPDVEADLATSSGIGPTVRRLVRQMAADGWLGIGWPTQYGGQGRSAMEQFIFFDESMRAGAPVPMLTINTVGPTLMDFGTEEQKAEFLPRILAGEIHFCIGYTEPNAGTDLASLTTKAVRDGDEYVINGAKIYTSLAGGADYIWLATRTDPEVSKHKASRCSSCRWTHRASGSCHAPHGHAQHQLHLLRGRAGPGREPRRWREHGWTLITNQLNHERVTLCSPGIIDRSLADVRAWAQSTKLPDGRRVIDQQWVQEHLARVRAELEYLRLINWKVAWQATQGRLDVADASSIKVFGTEFYLAGLPPASWRSSDRPPTPAGLAGGRARRTPRDVRPLDDHPHLWWGDQRDPAGPDSHLRLGMPRSLR